MSVSGWRNEPQQAIAFDIELKQSMGGAPIALWESVGYVDLGGRPAFIWVSTANLPRSIHRLYTSEQNTSFQRLGALFFFSLGFTVLDRHIYLGLQGQFLYGRTVEIGPFDALEFTFSPPPYEYEVFTLEAWDTRLDQLTMGPVIAINF